MRIFLKFFRCNYKIGKQKKKFWVWSQNKSEQQFPKQLKMGHIWSWACRWGILQVFYFGPYFGPLINFDYSVQLWAYFHWSLDGWISQAKPKPGLLENQNQMCQKSNGGHDTDRDWHNSPWQMFLGQKGGVGWPILVGSISGSKIFVALRRK